MRSTILISSLIFALLSQSGSAQEERQLRPPRPDDRNDRPPGPGRQGGGYNLEQATSDRAQLNTIAFNGLAFLTGDRGAASFIPPGKVADFFGFQYMRDVDAAGKGHNPMFLDRIAGNVMRLLTDAQRATFMAEARNEAVKLESLARMRLPLVAAFYQECSGDLPMGCRGLNLAAVQAYGADLFEADAALAWHRARIFASVAKSLSQDQRRTLGRWRFGDFRSWPEVDRDTFREFNPQAHSKLESVAFMTLASEFFSWVAGSVEADTYFCPERHGTYFGGFYLKDMPAMGQKNFDISTALTGDSGAAFLDALKPAQRARLTRVIEEQRNALQGIVAVRRAMALRLRSFLTGTGPTEAELRTLGREYGRLDGELAFLYATAFRDIARTMDGPQKARLQALRGQPCQEQGSGFLYSDRIPMPRWPDTSFLLGDARQPTARP